MSDPQTVTVKIALHGWVYPRPDGVRARCGGPGMCAQCKAEANFKMQQQIQQADKMGKEHRG